MDEIATKWTERGEGERREPCEEKINRGQRSIGEGEGDRRGRARWRQNGERVEKGDRRETLKI